MRGVRVGKLAKVAMCLAFLGSLCSCDRPCTTLADRLCEAAGSDDHACELWRDRIGRVPAKTCVVGLKALDRERTR